MKGILLPCLLFALVTLVNVIVPIHSATIAFPIRPPSDGVAIGIYDPHGAFSSDTSISIEHIFIDWNMPPERTRSGLRSAERRNRSLMVSLEPFPRAGQMAEAYVPDLLAGRYDAQLVAHCTALAGARGPAFLRFAHEMDLDNGRYAWSGLPAASYIAIYRHAVSLCRRLAPDLTFVWSPTGNEGLSAYYPGESFVDMVGLTLFGLEPWEELAYGRGRSFVEALAEKYRRIAGFGKPVTIAEFGVCGTPAYRGRWLADAGGEGPRHFPLLHSLVYFNDREPFRWPKAGAPRRLSGCDVEYPDWRLGR
jgi:endoglucanase